MKNICTFLLAVIILLSLTACGSSASTTSPAASDNADNTATVESGEASAEENQSEQQTSSGAVQVDEGLLNVTITLPASYFEDMTDFDPDTYANEQGFKEVVVNEDGSVSITMSKSKHNELMAEMKANLDQTFMDCILRSTAVADAVLTVAARGLNGRLHSAAHSGRRCGYEWSLCAAVVGMI